MMTRGSTKAVVVSSPSSKQARTYGVRAGELGLCCGLGSAHHFLHTLGLLSPALGEISLGSPGLGEGCSEALAYLQVVIATTHVPPSQLSGCGALA